MVGTHILQVKSEVPDTIPQDTLPILKYPCILGLQPFIPPFSHQQLFPDRRAHQPGQPEPDSGPAQVGHGLGLSFSTRTKLLDILFRIV